MITQPCNMKLWPHGLVRPIRFHHLRHTTAYMLMMAGANPAAVQRIMRHSDPRLTTEVYGHLAPGYLRSEIDRLQLAPPAPESPRMAFAIATTRAFATDLLQIGPFRPPRDQSRPRNSLTSRRNIRSGREDSNLRHSAPKATPESSQGLAGVHNCREPLDSGSTAASNGRKYSPPFTGDLLHPYFRADSRLWTVSEVAERLEVCPATIYKLCATGALQHVRVMNSIRVADASLQEFLARRPDDA